MHLVIQIALCTRSEQERLYVAPEVEDTLREMVAPKPDLAKVYSVTFSNATLKCRVPWGGVAEEWSSKIFESVRIATSNQRRP